MFRQVYGKFNKIYLSIHILAAEIISFTQINKSGSAKVFSVIKRKKLINR